MKTDIQKSGSPVGRWVKKSLCAGIVMGLAMSAGTSFAGEDLKEDNGNLMTPFSRIAHVQVVKDEFDNIDREATYKKAKAVATAIANHVATISDKTSGYPADWIVGGFEHTPTGLPLTEEEAAILETTILRIPSPNLIDPANADLGVKKANIIEFCNAYYAKQALGVAPIAGYTPDTKLPDGYIHAPALPCEVSTWNDDENIYIDMLDPNAIFSIFFSDVLVSDLMQDPDFANAISALPVAVKYEIKEIVYDALDAAEIKYNAKDKAMGPVYKDAQDIFDVVAASPNNSPYKHVAYTKTDGGVFLDDDAEVAAQAIIHAMSIHGEDGAGTHDWDIDGILSEGSLWRSARHEPLGLPGKPEKNWVIEACSPFYAKQAMGTGMHHATALPCEITVQRVDRTGDGNTESLVISYLDPYFMFGALFSDMTDEQKAALGAVPGYIIADLQYIVKHALEVEVGGLDDGNQIWYTMLPPPPEAQ